MRQLTAIAASGTLLLLLLVLSLMLGAKSIAIHDVYLALTTHCGSADCVIVREARLPRTLAGLLAGCALGLAGVLM
ncbi:iron chelate uptake ABC transporter family permease subunit, partial [Pantoea septica]|uniref:iron chelate uptake ABC transporter family permease subunit n=1 Tax=Pantoea septica TaxID=472695 RepID=UPI0023F7F91F